MRFQSFLGDQRGAVAPLFALGLIGFVSAGALAWDVSRGFALRAELEAAVDAAALAGATQLDGQSGARARAIAAAEGALVVNGQKLADDGESNVAADLHRGTGDSDIVFLKDLTTRAVAENDQDAQFIEINLAPRTMGLTLGALVRATGFNVTAHAVAGYGSAICMAPPIMICNPDPTVLIDPFAAHAGKGVILNGVGGGQSFAPGNFGYLQVNDPDEDNQLKALQDAMGRSPPRTECFGDQVETKTGDPTPPLDWFNMRFDIYDGKAVSALKDDPHYAPAENTITGLNVTSGGSHSLCTPSRSGLAYNGDAPATVTTYFDGGGDLEAMPLPRDICAYSPNSVSTSATCASGLGTGTWDRTNYFKVTHNITAPIDPITTPTGETWASIYDYPGVDPTLKPTYPTRYQVYLWEKANLDSIALWSKDQDAETGDNKDFAKPRCGTASPPSGVDRRRITVVVLNCNEIQNNRPAPIRGSVDIFLTEPASLNGNGSIFGEVIDSNPDAGNLGQQTRFHSVRLYE